MRSREHPAVVSGKNDTLKVDPRKLTIDPSFNVRDLNAASAREALDELKEQIRFEGVRVPLELRLQGDNLVVVSGHRRHKVVMELIGEGVEILTVPAITEPATVGDADRVAGLITMNAGLPLTQLEKAEVVRRLLGYGWDRELIRKRLGFKATQSVADLEALLSLPQEVKDEVRAGNISATTARHVVRRDGPLLAAETIGEARKTAEASGKSRVTPKTLKRAPTYTSRPPIDPKTVIDILAGTLRDIATQGDGVRSRKIARTCLTLQGFAVPPELQPIDTTQGDDEIFTELSASLAEMVTTYCDTVRLDLEHGGQALPDEEQPACIQRALAILNRARA